MEPTDTLTPTIVAPDEAATLSDQQSHRDVPESRRAATGASWSLGRDPTAACLARQLTHQQLRLWRVDDDRRETAVLLVTELVTNALRHGAGRIDLSWVLLGASVRCGVADRSLHPPRPRPVGPGEEDGRGLQLVEALAAAWGHRRLRRGKVVWFEL